MMPIADGKAFDRTVQEAVQVNEPPPGTDFGDRDRPLRPRRARHPELLRSECEAPGRDRPHRWRASSKEILLSLAAAANGTVFGEGDLGAVTHAVRSALGSGPTKPTTVALRTRPLGPYFALAALLPLLFVMLDGLRVPLAAARLRRRQGSGESHPATEAGRPDERPAFSRGRNVTGSETKPRSRSLRRRRIRTVSRPVPRQPGE